MTAPDADYSGRDGACGAFFAIGAHSRSQDLASFVAEAERLLYGISKVDDGHSRSGAAAPEE